MNTIICKQCRQNTAINQIRYHQNGKDLICVACFKKAPEVRIRLRDNFHCLYCNYKFSIARESKVARKCPYCASANIVDRGQINSKSILRAVTQNPEVVYAR